MIFNLYTITVKPVYPTTHLFCIIPDIAVLICDVIHKNAVATNQRFAFIIHIRTTSDTYEERIVSTPCSGSTVINSIAHVCIAIKRSCAGMMSSVHLLDITTAKQVNWRKQSHS